MNHLLDKIQQNDKNQYRIFFLVLVLITLFMILCNGSSSIHSGYDFFFQYRRLDVLIDALRHGDYISYIDYSNLDGYGYMVKAFYPDLILIPFAVIGIFTGTYAAYDIMIFVMTILCGLFMYRTVKVIYKNTYTAAISSILYTFAVYRLYDIYHRGALAESLSFTFLPIVFLGLYYIIQGDYKRWYILAIGFSLMIYTHAIASVLMFLTLLILCAVYYKKLVAEPKRIIYLCLAGTITVLLTAYYIFPALEQLLSESFYLDSRNPGGGAGYGKVGFDYIFWGFVSGVAYRQGLWAGIGIILTMAVLLRLFIRRKWDDKQLRSVDIGVIISICFIIATSRIFPWGRFPFNLLSFIQYPWRLYEFASYFFAIAGGFYLSLLFVKNKSRIATASVVIVFTMVTIYIHSENFKMLDTLGDLQIFAGKKTEIPHIDNRFHTIGSEYLPSRLPAIEYVKERGEIVESDNGDSQITNLKRNYNHTSLDVTILKADSLTLPILYYKGYAAKLNGKELPVVQSNYGFIKIPVNESGRVKAYYKGTSVQKTSFFISIICTFALIFYIIRSKRNRRHETN